MHELWWQLPGPNHFIKQITESLADGKNVVLRLPSGAQDGLASELKGHLASRMHRELEGVRVPPDSHLSPGDLLFRRYVVHSDPTTLRNAASLVNTQGFSKKLIWIDSLSEQNWSPWKSFLEDYEHACRMKPESERSLFCIPLIGEITNNPPKTDVALELHSFQNTVDHLDMLAFTSSLMIGKSISSIKRRVAISVIAHLALWDRTISQVLSNYDLKCILEPVSILSAFAHQRNWNNIFGQAKQWQYGIRNTFEGKEQLHSAYLAIQKETQEIKRRIWSAQMEVLFPIIEQRRHELLEQLDNFLYIPFTTKDGVYITDKYRLEIGHIEWQLINHKRNGRKDFQLESILANVTRLKSLRNNLAHLKVIQEDDLVF